MATTTWKKIFILVDVPEKEIDRRRTTDTSATVPNMESLQVGLYKLWKRFLHQFGIYITY